MTLPSDPIFIIDLNEMEDGDTIVVSDEYTVQYGARRKFFLTGAGRLQSGAAVRVESDEDRMLYWASIVEVLPDGEYRVVIDWESGAPVLNEMWAAARDPHRPHHIALPRQP